MSAPPDTADVLEGTGVYLHVPFCAQRCGYCDFNTYTVARDAFGAPLADIVPAYVSALRADLRRIAAGGPRAVAAPGGYEDDEWPTFTSVFVGGGTPTLLPAEQLAAVVRDVRAVLPVSADAEITVEANPETVTVDKLGALVDAGVNRVSMGAQSFRPHVLRFLDRAHDPDRPLAAVAEARAAGVAEVNLDLIYGAPAESDADWAASLRAVLAAGTEHVSAYALTLEPNTPYAAQVQAGQKPAPDDDVAATRMAMAEEVLAAAGYARYEISNWALPGCECRHNLTYWRGGNWLGIGAGAHGHWAGRRWWSWRAPGRYVEAALAGMSTTSGAEVLGADERRDERLLLGLRLEEGLARASVEPLDDAVVEQLVRAGLLVDRDGRLRLTAAGRAVANGVIVRLLR